MTIRKLALAAAAALFVVSACGTAKAERLKADNPLTDEQAVACLAAVVNADLADSIAGETEDPGLAVIHARMDEYSEGVDVDSLPKDEQWDALMKVARRLGQDADVATLCGTVAGV